MTLCWFGGTKGLQARVTPSAGDRPVILLLLCVRVFERDQRDKRGPASASRWAPL